MARLFVDDDADGKGVAARPDPPAAR